MYKNKYRVETARHPAWNYSYDASYFITICTAKQKNYFARRDNENMCFSEIGKAANTYWSEIPTHFPFVELDSFTIMPNHIHGILIINKNKHRVETQDFASNDTSKEAQNFASLLDTIPVI